MKFKDVLLPGSLLAFAGTMYLGVKMYQNFHRNSVNICVMEFISLPTSATESFTDLAFPVTGEVRLDTLLTKTCRFLIKLNASDIAPDESSVASPSRNRCAPKRPSVNSNSSNQGSITNNPHNNSSSSVHLSKVVLHEMLDAWKLERTGHLELIPPCAASGLMVLQYASTPKESFSPAVSIKQCWVQPSSTPGAQRLSFDLFVHFPVMELCVTFGFPKGCQILSFDTQSVGEWGAVPGSPNEIIWDLGSVVDKGAGNNKASKFSLRKRDDADDTSVHNMGRGTPNPLNDELVGFTCDAASGFVVLGSSLCTIRFEAQYLIKAPNGDGQPRAGRSGKKPRSVPSSRGPTPNPHRGVATPNIMEGNILHADVCIPSVHLTYTTKNTTSGLFVKQLKTLEETENWVWVPTVVPLTMLVLLIRPFVQLIGRCVSGGDANERKKNDSVLEKNKLSKRVKYRSKFQQPIQVITNF